ncbi:MAG: hypothetical protein R3C11_01670 [Planctomycetaceae bacterium]
MLFALLILWFRLIKSAQGYDIRQLWPDNISMTLYHYAEFFVVDSNH